MARRRPEIRLVTWVDSASQTGWESDSEYRTLVPAVCVTVGFVMGETAEYLLLGLSLDDGTTMNGAISIPKVAIRRSTTLRKSL
jgi:hypothetical protein